MRWRNQSYVVLASKKNVFLFLGRAWRQICLKKKRGRTRIRAVTIRLRKKVNAHGVKRKFAKKKNGTDSHLSDSDPFEKKVNAHGVKRDFLFFLLLV